MPSVTNLQKTELKVVSLKCLTIKQTYNIKSTATKLTWTLDSANAVQKSVNFDYSMVKIELTN